MSNLRIKNWSKYQHYKDRNPPWIKLATDTFQDYEFSRLQDASKLLAVCIWTLASRSAGATEAEIPHDFAYIKSQCCLGDFIKESHLNELITKGYLVASEALADCKQNACPETETETETEERQRESHGNVRDTNLDTPDSLMQAVATELRITDQFVRISLSEQIRLALEAGEDGQKTCEAMIESGRAYRDSKKFEFGGWKKFFGSDAWRVKPTTKRKSVVEEAYDDLHAPLPQANQ